MLNQWRYEIRASIHDKIGGHMKKALNIGKQIEIMNGTDVPFIGDHQMTIGELITRIVPVANSGSDYMRAMNLGYDIDRAISANESTFDISSEDRKLLRRTVIDNNNHPIWSGNWAKWNLEKAFEEE